MHMRAGIWRHVDFDLSTLSTSKALLMPATSPHSGSRLLAATYPQSTLAGE